MTHKVIPVKGCCKKCGRESQKKILTKIIEISSNGKRYLIGTNHLLYNLRYSLMSRCKKPRPTEKCYRGIKVCDEWINSPTVFYQWCLDNGWRKGLSIDRINPDEDYEPKNCQFLTMKDNLSKSHLDRKMFGENAHNVKLTDEKVELILERLKLGVTLIRLANEFNVKPMTIARIRDNRSWKHIERK